MGEDGGGGWRLGSAIESICCSSRRPELGSQNSHQVAPKQLSVIPSPGDLLPPAHMWQTHTERQHITTGELKRGLRERRVVVVGGSRKKSHTQRKQVKSSPSKSSSVAWFLCVCVGGWGAVAAQTRTTCPSSKPSFHNSNDDASEKHLLCACSINSPLKSRVWL